MLHKCIVLPTFLFFCLWSFMQLLTESMISLKCNARKTWNSAIPSNSQITSSWKDGFSNVSKLQKRETKLNIFPEMCKTIDLNRGMYQLLNISSLNTQHKCWIVLRFCVFKNSCCVFYRFFLNTEFPLNSCS